MPKVITAYNNFARGQTDHDMNGRFDLPIYKSSSDKFENFLSNFKGNAIFRTGFEDMVVFEDCRIHEFKFNNEQNYIAVFYNTKVKFLTYASDGSFGWVQNGGGSDLEVTTPYSLAESKELQFTQNKDVMVITHNSHAPQDLTRVSATSFTIAAHTLNPADPFGNSEYPASCLFYKGRLYFARTPSKTTTVWGSEAGDYDEFTVPATATDISPLEFTIADIAQPIEWLFGGDNSLLVGCADGVVAVNGGGVGVAIKADTIEADLTSGDGTNAAIPFKKDNFAFYVGKDNRNLFYFNYDILTESFSSQDANFLAYDLTKGLMSKIRHKKDRNDLIYALMDNGDLLSLNFKEKENIVGWHNNTTEGTFEDIVVITDNEGNPQLFALTLRNSVYYIERQADHVEFSKRVDFFTDDKAADDEAYTRMVAEELNECLYLDNALKFSDLQESNTITYGEDADSAYDSAYSSAFGSGYGEGTITDTDGVFVSGDVGKHISYKTATGYESGRFEITNYIDANTVDVIVLQEPTVNTYDDWYLSFDTVTGLSKFNGLTVGVVADGGYLDDYVVADGEIEFDRQLLNVSVGYKYKGIIKSFNLGFQINAENTQTTMKSITRTGLRFVSSAGGQFGSSLYRMEPIQELSQKDINYLPPAPMDGTKYAKFIDSNEKDKYFYVVQDEPLPLVLTTVLLDANYSVTR